MTLHAEISGDIALSPPLVLVHGFGGSATAWDAVRRHLPADLPVIAYDLPGHGRSIAAEGRGGAGKMAKAILADLEARGVRSFHIAGHSMGGAVSSLVAMRAGSMVVSLTLAAPGGMGREINHRVLSRFALAKSAEEIRMAMEPMLGFNFTLADDAVAKIVADRAMPGAQDALIETYNAMFADPAASIKHQGTLPMEALAALAPPVTALWGTQDAILPFHQLDALPDSFTKIRIEETGHMLLDECPQIVAELLCAAVKPR
jgi:pimeloyl-ACP methyl ester carboxylesterase